MAETRVWIDQDLCTGDGICVELCSPLFDMGDDGLAYVKEAEWPDLTNGEGGDPKYQMAEGTALVPDKLLDDAIEAAEACPGECIFFDVHE